MREKIKFETFEHLQGFIRGLEYVNIEGLYVETFYKTYGEWEAIVVDEREDEI